MDFPAKSPKNVPMPEVHPPEATVMAVRRSADGSWTNRTIPKYRAPLAIVSAAAILAVYLK